MNRHGDLPVTILVIGVFVVCTAALVSFYGSSLKIESSFEGVNLIEKMNLQIENYITKQVEGDMKTIGTEPFYQEKWSKKWYTLWLLKDIKVFSVRYEKSLATPENFWD